METYLSLIDLKAAEVRAIQEERPRYNVHNAARRRGGNYLLGRGLSPQETRVWELVQRGIKNKDIAAQLGISIRTVETYRARVYDKTGICRGNLKLTAMGDVRSAALRKLLEESK